MILDAMIFEYLDRIEHCSRSQEVVDALAREAMKMGLSAVACWMLTGPKAASRNPFYANNWPRSWQDIYERHGFFEKDPFARWAISSGAPVSWGTLLRRLPANDPGHKIGQAARSHGFREGFGMPVRSSTGHLGLFSFFGDRRPLLRNEQIFLQAICPGTLHRLEALAPAAGTMNPAGLLSARERECATLLCEGLNNPAIAARLGISVATVKFHLRNACGKLGARSRAQLAALIPAGNHGPIESPGSTNGTVCTRPVLLLRSTDGRFFEIASDVALSFEVKPGEDGRPRAENASPAPSEADKAAGSEIGGDIEPYWIWLDQRNFAARWESARAADASSDLFDDTKYLVDP